MSTIAHLIHLEDITDIVSDEFLIAAVGYLSHELDKQVNSKNVSETTPLTEWLENDDDHRVLIAKYLLELDELVENTYEEFFANAVPLLESTLEAVVALPEYILLMELLERDKEDITKIQTHRYRQFFFVIITYKDAIVA